MAIQPYGMNQASGNKPTRARPPVRPPTQPSYAPRPGGSGTAVSTGNANGPLQAPQAPQTGSGTAGGYGNSGMVNKGNVGRPGGAGGAASYGQSVNSGGSPGPVGSVTPQTSTNSGANFAASQDRGAALGYNGTQMGALVNGFANIGNPGGGKTPGSAAVNDTGEPAWGTTEFANGAAYNGGMPRRDAAPNVGGAQNQTMELDNIRQSMGRGGLQPGAFDPMLEELKRRRSQQGWVGGGQEAQGPVAQAPQSGWVAGRPRF